jgi:SAM-dependent methyltransferase
MQVRLAVGHGSSPYSFKLETQEMNSLYDRAKKIAAEGIFLGGKQERFVIAGRTLFITLLSEGLFPGSKVLDIGCGCLRGGYWLIHFLEKGCYCGIEPNREMLDAGLKILLEPGLLDLKQPRFDHDPDFNFANFKEKFDFLVGLSIWTHAAKSQIQVMLDGFVEHASPGGVFITTYYPATLFRKDYKGVNWIGTGSPVQPVGMVHHSRAWIQAECEKRGLLAGEITEPAFKYWNQTWLRIKRKSD